MLERTFHTPLPLDLEVGIPSGGIEVETTEGEESNITVDGDERLLEEVEIRQDGNRVVVAYRGKGKFGFSLSPFTHRLRRERPARAGHRPSRRGRQGQDCVRRHGARGRTSARSASTPSPATSACTATSPATRTSRRSAATPSSTRVDGDVTAQTVSGDVRLGPVGGSAEAKTVSGDIRFDAVSSGDVRFTSVSGDIEIGIAAGLGGRCRRRLDLGRPLVGGSARQRAGRGRGRRRPDRRAARSHRERRREGLPRGLMREVLAHRDARLLLAGQALSAFGDWAMLIVLAVWMKTLTGSSALAGLAFFTFAAGSLLAPLGGLLADRVRRRPLMIVSDCVLGAFVLVLLLVHDRSDAWLIYAVAFAYGALGTVFYPARAALLKVMLPEELLAPANGALTTTREGLRIIAPLAGAGLYAVFGGSAVAVLDSATFAASVFFLSRMRVHEEKPAPPEHHFLREVTAGMRHVWDDAAPAPGRARHRRGAPRHRVRRDADLLGHDGASARSPRSSASSPRSRGSARLRAGSPRPRWCGGSARCGWSASGLAVFAVADLCLIVPSLGVVLVAGADRRRRHRLGDRRLLDGPPDADAAGDPGARLRCGRPHALGGPDDVDRDRRVCFRPSSTTGSSSWSWRSWSSPAPAISSHVRDEAGAGAAATMEA